MTYEREDDRIRLTMTAVEFNKLLFLIGVASGNASKQGDDEQFREFLALANAINNGNRDWIPYE